MFEEIERLTRALCAEHGTSGCEGDVFKVAKKELGFCKEVCENELGGVVGIFGDLSSKRRILLDAHIDQIGMIVTDIDENGSACDECGRCGPPHAAGQPRYRVRHGDRHGHRLHAAAAPCKGR